MRPSWPTYSGDSGWPSTSWGDDSAPAAFPWKSDDQEHSWGSGWSSKAPDNLTAQSSWPGQVGGSQTSSKSVNYAVLLADGGWIDWPVEGRAGRKPGKVVRETPMRDWEKKANYDWAGWWMDLARFPNAESRDSNGFSPLHHALDACVYAVRAGKAAEQLIAHRSRGARRVARLRLSILGRLFFREVRTLCANFCTWRSGTQMMTNCLTSFPDYVCDNP